MSVTAVERAFAAYPKPDIRRCPCGCNAELVDFIEGDNDALHKFDGTALVGLSKEQFAYFIAAALAEASEPGRGGLRMSVSEDLARLGWRVWPAEERLAIEGVIAAWLAAGLLEESALAEVLGWVPTA